MARDRYGAELLTWAQLGEPIWADKRPGPRAVERYIKDSNRTLAQRSAVWRIRAPSDVNELDRIVDADGITWGIVGLKVDDRRWVDLQCLADTSSAP